MPVDNSAYPFLMSPEQRQARELEIQVEREYLHYLEGLSDRLFREAGLLIQPQLLAGTSFDKETSHR